jgi:aryl-alcohol dehydrogenase-like predicted oxidoreductase
VFDAYAEAGGNFIDTADMYAAGESERILSDLLAKDRDHFVLASKYTQFVDRHSMALLGNSRKAMHRAIDASLRRLKTDYLDVFYLHVWDGTTPMDEVMRAFEDLIAAGKVLYPAVSNIPAWIVARGQTIAELRGGTPLAALQIQYSLAARTPERDLIPMADSLGITVVAWAPLGGGILTGKYRAGVDKKTNRDMPIRPEVIAMAEEIKKVSHETGATPAQIALAWLLDRNVIPVVGVRSLAQLNDNLGALKVSLPPEAKARVEALGHLPGGYPHELLASPFMDKNIFLGDRNFVQRDGTVVS